MKVICVEPYTELVVVTPCFEEDVPKYAKFGSKVSEFGKTIRLDPEYDTDKDEDLIDDPELKKQVEDMITKYMKGCQGKVYLAPQEHELPVTISKGEYEALLKNSKVEKFKKAKAAKE